ncbi:MAG: putative dsRNA-binding protein [Methanolobus sp.]|nr:putative dsRNA-binding protein [Methanolobus sp.]
MRVNADLSVNESDLEEFQQIIGFRFKDQGYLIQALLHGSLFSGNKEKMLAFRNKNNLGNKDYEKLEYLGDSVLGMIIAEYAYHDRNIDEYAKENCLTIEGVCTKIRQVLASNVSLKPVATKIKLSRFILSGEYVNIDGKLSDIIEALIGAIYLDGGCDLNNEGSKNLCNLTDELCMENPDSDKGDSHKENRKHADSNYLATRDFVYRFFDIYNAIEKIPVSNPKGMLQERFHEMRLGNPCYKLIDEDGPDHKKQFTVGLYIDDRLLATGSGDNKKKAEQAAATLHLKHLKKENEGDGQITHL